MILDKYKGKTKDNRLLPVLSNQKINAYLKEIADLCGIKKRLSYHLARHTFATMLLSKGVPIESVSKMLGHTNIKTTQIYARITNKKIEQDMMQVADKFDGFKKLFHQLTDLLQFNPLLRGKRPVTPLPSRIIPAGRYGFFHIVPFLIPLLSVRMLPEQIAGNNQHKRKRHQLPYQDESFFLLAIMPTAALRE